MISLTLIRNNSGFALLAVLLATSFTSCNSSLFDKRVSEGEIDYEITYPKMDPDNLMADFMPDHMTMRFKDNVLLNEISAGMGIFRTRLMINSNDYTFKHMVKLMNKKYATVLSKQDVDQYYQADYPEFLIIHFDETKEVAGYQCNKALIIYDEVNLPSFYCYYTDKIRFDHPNWSNPFHELDGVLMEYEVEQYDILMRFKAISVNEADVENEEFELTEEYDRISAEEMKTRMNEIFETLK